MTAAPGNFIYYTTDGSDPDRFSFIFFDGDFIINVTETTTIRAVAWDFDEYSAISEATYELDVDPPQVTSVSAAENGRSVVVTFDEEVTQESAENINNYFISNTFISAASLENGNTVTLSTTPLTNGLSYNLNVEDIADIWGNIQINQFVAFTYTTSEPQSYSAYAAQFSVDIGPPDADFDQDGLNNLVEYFCGCDPTQVDALAEILRIESDGISNFFIFRSPISGRPDLTVSIQKSSNLLTWDNMLTRTGSDPWPDSPALSNTDIPANDDLEIVQFADPINDDTRYFYRLSLQTP